MHKLDLLKLESGLGLDEYIASHYMGFENCSRGAGSPPGTENRILIPPYSTNPGAAFTLAEKTIPLNWYLVVVGPFSEGDRWAVTYTTNGDPLEIKPQEAPFKGDNLAILICRAVIEIIEKE